MILCCGEMLIDMIPQPTTSGAQGYVPHAGGAIYNTAIALGRLGTDVGMLSGVSSDLFGQQLIAGLEASKVDTSRLIVSDRPTTLAFVQLADGHASYRFYDENSAGRMLTADQMPALDDAVQALYLGGISLACEPGADAYAALLKTEGGTRAVMIDPNIRPAFIADAERYRKRLSAMMQASDIIKVSDEDLGWLDGSAGTLADKARALLDKGASLVIVTRGSAGATGFLPESREVHVLSRKVEVVDTVGAGDTFNAGVLSKLSELGMLSKSKLSDLTEDHVQAALRHGASVAAITVSRAGANPPWADEL